MFDLFVSDYKRYRKLALIMAVVQLFAWLLMAKAMPTLAPHPLKLAGLLALSTIGGLAFGLISMGLHKRKNHWTYLVHRPLPINRIFAALSSAGLVNLFIAISLPLLVIVGFLDLTTSNVVDARHYWTVIHIFAISTTAYFLGCYAVLSPAKASFLSFWLLVYVAQGNNLPLWQELSLDAGYMLFSGYLAFANFKVNPNKENSCKLVTITAIIALQPALLLIVLMTNNLFYHVPVALTGNHPNKDLSIPSYQNFLGQKRADSFAQLLKTSDSPYVEELLRQSEMSEYHFTRRSNFTAPYKQQLFFKEKPQRFSLPEPETDIQWIFSHKEMAFIGRNTRHDKIVGYLGPFKFADSLEHLTINDRFNQAATVVDNRFIQTSNTIYTVDFKARKITKKYQLPHGEHFTKTVKYLFERAIMQSNKATYLFDEIDFNNPNITNEPEHIVPLPGQVTRFNSIVITEVLDGFLIAYADQHLNGYHQTAATLIYVQHSGEQHTIASLEFEQYIPDFIQYQAFIISPILVNTLNGLLPSSIKLSREPYSPYQFFWQRALPQSVIIYSILFMLLTAITSTWLVRHLSMSKSNKVLWIAASTLASLPGLCALIIHNFSPLYAQYKKNKALKNSALQSPTQKEQANV